MSNAAFKYSVFNEGEFDTQLITGALLWFDMKSVARLIVAGVTQTEIKRRILADNLLQRKSPKTARNIFSYILKRLQSSPPYLVELIAKLDSVSSKQAAFVATLITSRFLREFFSSVVCDRLDAKDRNLPPHYWQDFWETCVAADISLAALRPKTISELKTVILKFLVELSILESARDLKLNQIQFTPQISAAVSKPELLWLTPCLRSFLR